ncbi:hypothetical protein DAPPUDRAFT_234919 [Daphnia pulex]|uniref:Uncharacterized protein n=1 Tax=Daphnia pulex TaxID=6669 RepID=E9FXS5_DAPPU|nr:hypothetical protein DAPPUDRAFT_234919 [Daphnia pulex]|eukprot:EFX88235.1 hypothetical protein DAPPUDRAFT_234919 [Daphnia pulex]
MAATWGGGRGGRPEENVVSPTNFLGKKVWMVSRLSLNVSNRGEAANKFQSLFQLHETKRHQSFLLRAISSTTEHNWNICLSENALKQSEFDVPFATVRSCPKRYATVAETAPSALLFCRRDARDNGIPCKLQLDHPISSLPTPPSRPTHNGPSSSITSFCFILPGS